MFYSILLDLTRLQLDLLDNNVIIRGGIAIGKLRHTQTEIFGPAMNEAYYLESKIARYPRIVIYEDTVNDYLKKMADSDYDKKMLESILRKDANEHIYYLDYLGNSEVFSSYDDYDMMLQMVKVL